MHSDTIVKQRDALPNILPLYSVNRLAESILFSVLVLFHKLSGCNSWWVHNLDTSNCWWVWWLENELGFALDLVIDLESSFTCLVVVVVKHSVPRSWQIIGNSALLGTASVVDFLVVEQRMGQWQDKSNIWPDVVAWSGQLAACDRVHWSLNQRARLDSCARTQRIAACALAGLQQFRVAKMGMKKTICTGCTGKAHWREH